MPKVHVNGIDLFYDIQGKGEPLLLISGFMCDHAYWSLLMPSLKQYQVIRFDNRGFGRTSAPDSPYTIQQMATDAAALLETIGINKIHLAGHSMGGLIAQEIALAHPEKVKSLILLSSLAKGDGRFNSIVSTWGELPRTLDWKTYQQIILPWIFTDEFYSIPGMIDMIIKMAVNYQFPPTPQGIYHQSRAILGCDTTQRLKDIQCPTLILVGKQDILTPVKFSHQLAQGIPQAELVVLNSGGHGFLIESPEDVAAAMLKFLSAKQS
ncbi:alpha/beta hydrolase [Calothrix sp. FACHB-156]|nr:alpha/beta hydrolase [Calothrix sp. FACHB-156]